MTLKTQWLGPFAWKAIVLPWKLEMKLLEMGKNMKIKHSIFSLSKVWRDIFLEKALHEGTNFFGHIYGGVVLHGV